MLRRSISVIAVIIACIYVLYFIFTANQFSQTRISSGISEAYSYSLPEEDTAFGGIFYKPVINDSLPHYQYKHIEDSILRITEKIKLNNRGMAGGGMSSGAFSVTSIQDELSGFTDLGNDQVLKKLLDSLSLLDERANQQQATGRTNGKHLLDEVNRRYRLRYDELLHQQQAKNKTLYYLGLNGYDKNKHTTEFFLDKGTNNLAYFVTDKVHKSVNSSTNSGHYERKRIAVRYAAEDHRVLIPITKRQYQIASAALNTAVFGTIFLLVYILIGLPLRILISISKGQAFTLQNIQRFKLMAVTMLVASLITVFTPYLFRLFYRNIIPDELVLKPLLETLYNQLSSMIFALGVFFIGKAFEKGYELQQENALTI